jgi:hypothetical protein
VIWGGTTTTLNSVDVGGQAATVQSTTLASSATIGRQEFATLDSLSSGGNKVITATMSANVAIGSGLIVAWSFTGTNTSGVFDKGNSASSTGVNASLSLVTVADHCHILAILALGTSNVPTAGSGYTLVDLTDEDWWNTSEKLTSFDATPAGSKTVNFTNTNAAYALSVISLAPAAGASDTLGAQICM